MKYTFIGFGVLAILVVLALWYAREEMRRSPSIVHSPLATRLSSVEPPPGWQIMPDPSGTSLLYYENGDQIANISLEISIPFTNMSAMEAMTTYSAKELLDIRFKSIQNEISENPDINWKNFKLQVVPQEGLRNGFELAEGSFTVYESILGKVPAMQRNIKRVVVYTEEDLLEIVFASSDMKSLPEQDKQFETFLDNLLSKISNAN